jgi:hypothetical protein
MASTFGYFTSWWLWIFLGTLLGLVAVLLAKLCLDFPRLLCCAGCEEELPVKRGYSEEPEPEEGEDEEDNRLQGIRSIG